MKQVISRNGYSGTIKLGALRAKGHVYPQFRLPERYSNCVGDRYCVYASEDGKTIVLTAGLDTLSELVLQLSPEVLQPQLSATTASDPIIVHEPLRDTPTGCLSRGPERGRGRHLSLTQNRRRSTCQISLCQPPYRRH